MMSSLHRCQVPAWDVHVDSTATALVFKSEACRGDISDSSNVVDMSSVVGAPIGLLR